MAIRLQGYNSRYITFLAEGELEPGNTVILSENDTVKRAASGKFAGLAHSLRGQYALIQTGGFAESRYSGTAPSVGFQKLAADADAGVTVSEQGREVLITSVDPANKTVGFLF